MKLSNFFVLAALAIAVPTTTAARKTIGRILERKWPLIAAELDSYGLLEQLKNPLNDFTVVVPRDAVFFKDSPYDSLDASTQENYLAYSIINQALEVAELDTFNTFNTQYGAQTMSILKRKQLSAEGIRIKNINTGSNGYIFVARAPLLPSWLSFGAQPNLAELIAQLKKTKQYDNILSLRTSVYTDYLQGNTDYTVFAATKTGVNQASATLSGLTDEQVQAAVETHIIVGALMLSDLNDGDTLTAVDGTTYAITVVGTDYFIDGFKIQRRYTDNAATNGYVHLVDGFLGV
jgi:uncharacterized surface protein with fasciclin (FAS1) repeats